MAASDQDYYARRERQARELAERAGDSSARAAHLTMAKRYGELAARTMTSSGANA